MVEIEFNYNQRITVIQAKLDEPFQNLINKFFQKSLLQPGAVYFLANGKQINNPQNKVESLMTDLNKQNKKMKVLVNEIEENEENNKYKDQVIIKSKDIICPNCKEPCRIKMDNCKIKFYECINGHETNNLKITDFENTQKINESQIICDKCKFKNKGNCPKDGYFRCLTCKQNLCLICRANHNINHNIILFDQKNYICQLHNEPFIKYCTECKRNICFSCQEHNNHKSIFLGDLMPDIDGKKKTLKEMKEIIDQTNEMIRGLIDQLKGFSEIINEYYEINKRILDNYDVKCRNFQVLKNLEEINNNNIIFTKLKNINDNKDLKTKIYDIIELYKNINENNDKNKKINLNNENNKKEESNIISSKENSNEINIIYESKNKNVIKIFDNSFINKNKDNFHLIIDGKKVNLCSLLKLNENQKKQETIQIKLINIKNITDISYMFSDSGSLFSLPDICKLDTKNVTDMKSMFYNCTSLLNLPGISNWDTKNVINMDCMFLYCTSLKSLPDISKWDTKNVTDMNSIFSCCRSLKSLPDISKWDTKNVTNMSNMFYECKSLSSLPDISKWNLKMLLI